MCAVHPTRVICKQHLCLMVKLGDLCAALRVPYIFLPLLVHFAEYNLFVLCAAQRGRYLSLFLLVDFAEYDVLVHGAAHGGPYLPFACLYTSQSVPFGQETESIEKTLWNHPSEIPQWNLKNDVTPILGVTSKPRLC